MLLCAPSQVGAHGRTDPCRRGPAGRARPLTIAPRMCIGDADRELASAVCSKHFMQTKTLMQVRILIMPNCAQTCHRWHQRSSRASPSCRVRAAVATWECHQTFSAEVFWRPPRVVCMERFCRLLYNPEVLSFQPVVDIPVPRLTVCAFKNEGLVLSRHTTQVGSFQGLAVHLTLLLRSPPAGPA